LWIEKNKVGSFSKSLYFFRAAEREEDIRAGDNRLLKSKYHLLAFRLNDHPPVGALPTCPKE
jgi:hypothetical protein